MHENRRPFISCNHAEKWAKALKKVYEEVNFIFRSRYNSRQYHLPLYFVPILQMQLKDPLVFSQLDTSPQLCISVLTFINVYVDESERNVEKRMLKSFSKQGGCSKSNMIALTTVSRCM